MADIALMLSAAAPLGLLSGKGAVLGIACAGGATAAWALYRIARSHGQLRGTVKAVGSLLAAMLWAGLVIAL
jgi:hypothetical protein